MTEDKKKWGDAFVYCGSHLGPHATGWCSVPVDDKQLLDAKNIVDAKAECRRKGLRLFREGQA